MHQNTPFQVINLISFSGEGA